MRCFRFFLVAVALALAPAAKVGLTAGDLAAVDVAPAAGAQIPMQALWQDEEDRDTGLG